ncbi:MAG: ATP-dependent DNA helicase [Acidimicrobiales bacterium]
MTVTAGPAARQALAGIVERLPGGERRDAQLDMCQAVAEALAGGVHLVVEAGTGVGKSLAYLVAAVLSGQRVVVATARKPLQDQLIAKDIPFVAAALPATVDAAVVKGRSNYLCLARLAEATGDGQGALLADRQLPAVRALAEWAETGPSGDLADAPVPVDAGLRAMVTVGPRECPGAAACEHGEECLAEAAFTRGRQAQLVVTNQDLYCLDASIGGGILGDHDAVVFDEAHELEPVASRTFGLELGRRRFGWLAGRLRGLLVAGAREPGRLEDSGDRLAAALAAGAGRRVDTCEDAVAAALVLADEAVGAVVDLLRKLPPGPAGDGRRDRCVQAASSLLGDVRRARSPRAGDVAWVPDGPDPVLNLAPVDVGPLLARLVLRRRTAVLTSATLSAGGTVAPLASRMGLRAALLAADGEDEDDEAGLPPAGPEASEPPYRELRLGSPFDYREHALLYCAAHLPDPRRMPRSFDDGALDELAGLMEAAGGRTLALFTSHRMLRLAGDALADRFPWPVLVQDGPPAPGLIERFRDDEEACLLATMGYWQGVDVPGRSLSLVVIDRLPFPSPRDPLLEARREAARLVGQDSFATVDLPLAATLLAQGVGRLVRSATDRGVVAVLDRRLATAGYRQALLDSLPPFRRTVDGGEARAYLAALAEGRVPTPVERVPRAARRARGEPPGLDLDAAVGMTLSLPAAGPGRVAEVLASGAMVELDGGDVAVVAWGTAVRSDGRAAVLRRPAPDRAGERASGDG